MSKTENADAKRGGVERADSERGPESFPRSWGTPPEGTEARKAWIKEHAAEQRTEIDDDTEGSGR